MARVDDLENFLIDIADAIKSKKGTNETILVSDFDTEILNLPGDDPEYETNLELSNEILGVTPPTPTLPYKELEYIETSGTQYINTMIFPDNTTKVDTSFKYEASGNDQYLFGGRTDYQSGVFQFDYSNGGSTKFNYGWGRENKWTVDKTVLDGKKLKLVTDGPTITITDYDTEAVLQQKTVTDRTFSSTYSVYLFALNESYGVIVNTVVKLYYFKLYKNNELVRDLIPVKRTSDNMICMYDKVSKTFFENQGTGSFIAGPEK